MVRKIMLRLAKQIIFNYFRDGITPVMGTNEMEGVIIGYEWRIYDTEYEKYRNGRTTATIRLRHSVPTPKSLCDFV